MNLYDEHAKEFSATRQSPWLGWAEVLQESRIRNKELQKIRVLDLGCGNGRFAKYLLENQIGCEYIGVDKSAGLLAIAKEQILKNAKPENNSYFKFIKGDFELEDWDSELQAQEFDLVVAFGIMHHIGTFERRKAFLRKAFRLASLNGLFAISYWQFGKLERYNNKKIHTDENKDSKYSENDFILNFGTTNAKRFCHFVNEDELKELELDLGFKESKTFLNDGKENNENLYRIYFK